MSIERFLELNPLIAVSYKQENFKKAKGQISEYLQLAEDHKSNWNYSNAIHQSYTYLGLIALKENSITDAKKYLLQSSDINGSPQLKSFGPNMLLAKELLELGERDVVIQYLDKCKQFWFSIIRFWKMRNWKKSILRGEIPDFGGNVIYYLS